MKLSLIQIGNSKGFRIPKKILEQYHITDQVELTLEDHHLQLHPIKSPRKDWGTAFKQMSLSGEDELLIPDIFIDETLDEWD
mgnify:FL=1|jgi:antitoxin MazE